MKKVLLCVIFFTVLSLASSVFADVYAQKDGLFWIDVPQEWRWNEDSGGVSIVSPSGNNSIRIDIELLEGVGGQEDVLRLVRETMSARILEVASQNGKAVLKTQRKIDGIFALHSGFIISTANGIRQATAVVFLKDRHIYNVYFEASREFQRMEMEAIVDTLKFEPPKEEEAAADPSTEQEDNSINNKQE